MSGITSENMGPSKDTVSMKEFITKLGEWMHYFVGKWKLFLIVIPIGALLGVLYSYTRKPLFVADVTFVVEDPKSGSLSGYSGIASQLGVDLGGLSGSSGSGVFSGDNIIGFLKSKLIVEKVLLGDTLLNGKRITLADMYMNICQWRQRKGWRDNPAMDNFYFPIDNTPDDLNRLQDSVIKIVYNAIIKNNLNVDKVDKKYTFIGATTISPDEIFSQVFDDRLVNAATSFYIKTKTQSAQQNVDKLQREADSVLYILNKKTYSAALSQDLNLNPATHVATVGAEFENRDKIVLAAMYEEIVKDLELAKMNLAQESPIIQVIDVPRLPLQVKNFGYLKGFVFGVFIAGFLLFVILSIKKIIKDALE
jgi:hypothetical protein